MSIPRAKPLKTKAPEALRAPKRLRRIADLEAAGLLPAGASEQAAYTNLAAHMDIAITPEVLAQMENGPDAQAIARQYVPDLRELDVTPQERADPIGDGAHSLVKGIVHRYPDRVLLKITPVCAVYCRYCFRKEMIGAGAEHLNEAELEAALAYIESHPKIWEVILTGGDPLILTPRRLGAVLDRLQAAPHVQVLRLHSRIPIASPQTITDTMLGVLQNRPKPITLIVHINHPQEITKSVEKSLRDLRAAGVMLLSQSVLLRGVNDDPDILAALFRSLLARGVKPYYLHHPDLARGTSHFRVSIRRGQEIMRALQGRVSGLCLPSYVLDIPGGYGKVPINHAYLRGADGSYRVEDYKGRIHAYPPDEAEEA
jgi:lysine 2,3-aminomutase